MSDKLDAAALAAAEAAAKEAAAKAAAEAASQRPTGDHVDAKGKPAINPKDENPSTDTEGNPSLPAPSNGRKELEEQREAEAAAKAAVLGEETDPEDKSAAATPGDGEKPDESGDEADTPEKWGGTGIEAADLALEMLQESGITEAEAKSALFDAVQTGDLSKVDMKFLTEKLGAAQAKLVMIGAEQAAAEAADKGAAIRSAAVSVVGSEEAWDAVTEHARKTMDEAKVAEYRDLLTKGDAAAKFVAQELQAHYNSDEANSTLNTSREEGDSSDTPTARALSAREYTAELDALHKTRGLSPADLRKKERALFAERKRGRAQGK